MTFEVRNKPFFGRTSSRVSIRRNGYIGVSSDVLWRHRLQDCRCVQLSWKPVVREIGIEFFDDAARANAASRKALLLALGKSPTGGGIINAKRFFRTFGIGYPQFLGPRAYRMVPLQSLGIDRDGEMLVLQLELAAPPRRAG